MGILYPFSFSKIGKNPDPATRGRKAKTGVEKYVRTREVSFDDVEQNTL